MENFGKGRVKSRLGVKGFTQVSDARSACLNFLKPFLSWGLSPRLATVPAKGVNCAHLILSHLEMSQGTESEVCPHLCVLGEQSSRLLLEAGCSTKGTWA